jgi:HEXXH motif-containing protein
VTSSLGGHRLSSTDLSALAGGEFTIESIRSLAAAEFSKHALLVEALRRASDRIDGVDCSTEIADAFRVLSEVQDCAPGVLTDVLTLPHLGFWAADCLVRLRAGPPGHSGTAGPPGSADLAYLAGFAAVAALRAGHPCELRLPVRDGKVFFPSLGFARLGSTADPGWASLRIDPHGARVAAGSRTVDVPSGTGHGRSAASSG